MANKKNGLLEVAYEVLGEGGWRPSWDDDGDVVFNNQGYSHFLSGFSDDPDFFVLLIPNVVRVSSPFELDLALDEANRCNAKCKFIKSWIHEKTDSVFFATEFLASDPKSMKRGVIRGCDVLPLIARKFSERLQERLEAMEN